VQVSKAGSHFAVVQVRHVAEVGSAIHWIKQLEAAQVLKDLKQVEQVVEIPVLVTMQVAMQSELERH